MSAFSRLLRRPPLIALSLLLFTLLGCSASQPRRPYEPILPQIRLDSAPERPRPSTTYRPASPAPEWRQTASKDPFPVMLGIDVLEAEHFAAVRGLRIGLLTHPAGVDRRGIRTVDILRHAPGVHLVALYGPEHGLNGDAPASVRVPSSIDPRTGLRVYSLYDRYRKPTRDILKGIDAMVIDLQDIGTRSYTFVSAMKLTMEACFENNVEVIVLDRPNPLGGLKVDGPLLDPRWRKNNYVGAFPVPYVHGLTIGELARMAKEAPGVLNIPDAVRQRGRLVIVPMRGWHRWMRWPDTGLRWVPTSPMIRDFAAVVGYPMVGLGTYIGDFRHGVGGLAPFRGLYHPNVSGEQLKRELDAFHIPGLRFRLVAAPMRDGRPGTGVYVDVVNWEQWHPTELNFYLMKLACRYDRNPFRTTPQGKLNGFLRLMGSDAFLHALQRDGDRVDVRAFFRDWEARDRIYQQASKRYWLYN